MLSYVRQSSAQSCNPGCVSENMNLSILVSTPQMSYCRKYSYFEIIALIFYELRKLVTCAILKLPCSTNYITLNSWRNWSHTPEKLCQWNVAASLCETEMKGTVVMSFQKSIFHLTKNFHVIISWVIFSLALRYPLKLVIRQFSSCSLGNLTLCVTRRT